MDVLQAHTLHLLIQYVLCAPHGIGRVSPACGQCMAEPCCAPTEVYAMQTLPFLGPEREQPWHALSCTKACWWLIFSPALAADACATSTTNCSDACATRPPLASMSVSSFCAIGLPVLLCSAASATSRLKCLSVFAISSALWMRPSSADFMSNTLVCKHHITQHRKSKHASRSPIQQWLL